MAENSHDAPPRVAYDFDETAKMFGRDRTWVYRQVKAGKIRAITGFGKMMVPAAEIDRISGLGVQSEAEKG